MSTATVKQERRFCPQCDYKGPCTTCPQCVVPTIDDTNEPQPATADEIILDELRSMAQPATAESEARLEVYDRDDRDIDPDDSDLALREAAHTDLTEKTSWPRPLGEHEAEFNAQPATPHTAATPWRLYGKQIQGFPNGNLQRKIVATVTTDAEQDTNDANGQLIVQAVNAHAALVEALEAALPYADALNVKTMPANLVDRAPQAIKKIRAALRLAGKGE